MRVGAVLHPTVLLAFVDGAGLLQHRDRPTAQGPVPQPEPDLPPILPEKRPQELAMDGSDIRFEGYRVETREHAGEYPDTMPQIIEVTGFR